MINNDTIPVFDPKKPFKAVDSVPEFDPNKPFEEKKNSFQNDLPTGTQTSKRGFEPFLPQVPTKTPSVLTPKGQVGYQEQVKDFKPIAQKQPPLPKVEKPLSNLESIKNTVYNVANSLKGVLPRLSLTSVDVFEKVIGKDLTGRLASLPRIEFSNDGLDIVTGRTPEQIRNESIQSLDYLNTQVAPTAGIVENARNFNIPGLAAGVIDAAGGLVSTIIPSALSGGSLLVTEMVGGGLYDYNTAKAKSKGVSTEELYKRGDADFGVPAAIGGVGYAMERIGLKGFTNSISKKLAGSGFKKALLLGNEWNREGFTEWVQVGLDEANIALANGLSIEDAVEAATDKMTSVQGLEAYAKGFAGSAAASGVGRAAKRLVSPKNKAKVSELEQQKNQSLQDLANENIPIEAKNAILDVLENTNEQIDDLVNIDRKEIEQLSESQAGRVGEINAKIEDIDLAINDVNISESTKSILEKQKQELDSELDGIIATPEIKLAKPTFDTEEQIIAEGQQAEADFQATDDVVTYEQKMKELEDRANQLIPEPTQESPKAEAKPTKSEDVISQTDKLEASLPDVTDNTRTQSTRDIIKWAENIFGKKFEGDFNKGEYMAYLQSFGNVGYEASQLLQNPKRALQKLKESGEYKESIGQSPTQEAEVTQNKQPKPQEDAIQVEAAGQVPVLTEAPVGEEVEQGKPQPKAEVVTEEGKEEVDGKYKKIIESIPVSQTIDGVKIHEIKTTKEIADILGISTNSAYSYLMSLGDDKANRYGYLVRGNWQPIEGGSNPKAQSVGWQISSSQEQTPAQEVKRLRAEEQAELKAAIPNADQYLTNGKVDRDKLTDPKDLDKFDEIYDKYDKLITPLLPKSETKAGSVVGVDVEATAKALEKLSAEEISKIKYPRKAIPTHDMVAIEHAGYEAPRRVTSANKNEIQIQGYGTTPTTSFLSRLIENGRLNRVDFKKGLNVRLSEEYATKLLRENEDLFPSDLAEPKAIAEAYHKAKKDGSNPELVKAVNQSLKETPQAETTTAKPKPEPRLKPRVETRIKFTKAIELFNDISAADGAAKKGTLARKRQKFLAQNPSIKYIDDNWRKISDQLKAKGLIETKGNCP